MVLKYLCDLGLQSKDIDYNIDQVRSRIQQELEGPGCCGGYRTVWHTLRVEGIQVPRSCSSHSFVRQGLIIYGTLTDMTS